MRKIRIEMGAEASQSAESGTKALVGHPSRSNVGWSVTHLDAIASGAFMYKNYTRVRYRVILGTSVAQNCLHIAL